MLLISVWLCAQTGPTAAPQQAPKTAPQVEQVLPSYEGQHVSSVELAGQPDLDTKDLLPLLAQRAGEPFARAKVDQTTAALQRIGRFQAVQVEIRPEATGIRVLFLLQPAIYFGIYEFPGASGRFAYSRLLQVSDYPPRGAYTPVDVRNAQSGLERFFRQNGYFQAEVHPQLLLDREHGVVNVLFNSKLNRRARFGSVAMQGATPEETQHLQRALRSWMARLRSSSLIPGKPYSMKRLQNAMQYLATTLMKDGFLGAQLKLVSAEYDPQTNRADIIFNVNTGRKTQVKVEGTHLWSWTEHKLLPVYQQAGINPEIIQEGRQNLLSHLQSKGYFDAKVTTQTQRQDNLETIVYQAVKGPRHKVANISIAGNQHIPSDELLSHVPLQKGRIILSHGKYSEKLVRASVDNLKRVYQAEGFSSVSVTPQVTRSDGSLAVTLVVQEGPQDIVESLRLEGNRTQSEAQLAPKGLQLSPGQAYSQKRADEDRNHILARYLTLGYLNASFRSTAQPVDKDPHRLAVVYHITEGPQVRIAEVVTLGNKVTRQSLISRTVNLPREAPLRENDLLTGENELYNLDIFDWAAIDPRRTITTQTQEDVLVKVHESKRNAITYGFGFEVINRGGSVPGGTVALPGLPPVGLSNNFKTSEKTFYGPRGSFEYVRRNLRGKAETITLTGLAGRLNQRGAITFFDPHFRSTNWSSTLTAQGEHNSENPIFTSRLAQFGFQLQHPLNPDKTTNIFVRYSLRQTALTRLLIPDLVPSEDQHVRLSTLAAAYVRDTRDNVLDAHKGIYQSYEINLNPSALGSSVNFAKLLTQTAYYKKIPANIVWANSVRVGIEEPFAGGHVPLSELFFSGGGSTLRGFPLNGAGPQRQLAACGTPGDTSTCSLITVPQGGKQLLILNSEFRIPVPLKKGLGVVGFYDGGNVFEHVGFHGQYTNTIGVGLRYNTPVGPIRVDVGHNLNAPPGIKSTQVFVTLGQSF